MHHVVATGQPATEYLPGYLGLCGDIWGNSHRPQVPIISPTGCNLCFLFAARISTACKSVFVFSSSSIIIIVTGRVYQFLLNHVQRSLTSLLLRVILAHTLAKISDDAGAFILFSLVSATQRRRQLPSVAGAHCGI